MMKSILISLNFILLKILRFYLRHAKKMICIHTIVFIILAGCISLLKPALSLEGLLKSESQIIKDSEDLVLVLHPKNNFLSEAFFCKYKKWKSDFVIKMADKFDFEITDAVEIRRAELFNEHLQFSSLVEIDCQNPNVSKKVNFELLKASPWGSVFGSSNSQDILLTIEASKELVDTWIAKKPSFVKEIFRTLKETGLEQDANVYISGKPAFEHFILDGLKQIFFLNFIFTVILNLLFRFFFGTFKTGFIATLPLTFSAIVLYGLMGLFNQPVNILISIAYLIMTLAALQDFLFLAYSQVKGRKVWIMHFTSYILPGFFTSLTTFIGFGSLAISNLKVIQEFGIWTAIGTSIEWYMLFLLFPCFLKEFKILRNWADQRSFNPVRYLDYFSKFQPKKLNRIPFLILAISGVISLAYININDSPTKVFPKNHLITESTEFLKNTRGWSGSFHLRFFDKNVRAKNLQLLERIQKIENIVFVENPYQELEYIFNTHDKQLKDAIERMITDRNFYTRIFPEQTEAMDVAIYLKNIDVKSLGKIKREIESICHSDCHTYGEIIDYVEFSNQAPKTLIESLGLSVILVGIVLVFLALATGQINKILPLCISSFWGVAVTSLIISIWQIEINFLTSVFSSILVGICGDYSIQFLLASRKNSLSENIDSRGAGAILTTLIMCCSGVCFVLSYFAPVRTLGFLLSVGLLAALVGDLWGLRLFLKKEFKPIR